MTFLLLVALAVIEVALALYGRNVAIAAAHEGARAAVELGARGETAAEVAREVVERSTGKLISGLDVTAELQDRSGVALVRVHVAGVMDPPGPLPVPVPIRVDASAFKERRP